MGQSLSSEPAADDPERWRQQAHDHAQRRGQLLQASQEAYQQGRGADAHQLSLQGKEEGQVRRGGWRGASGATLRAHSGPCCRLMEEANRKASSAAFRANNQPSEDVDVMDLHGLYVKEAEQASPAGCRGAQRLPCGDSLQGQRTWMLTPPLPCAVSPWGRSRWLHGPAASCRRARSLTGEPVRR